MGDIHIYNLHELSNIRYREYQQEIDVLRIICAKKSSHEIQKPASIGEFLRYIFLSAGLRFHERI